MTLIEIFSIIVIHWIADFIFQDEKWALGKSKNNLDLINHTFVYSMVWLIIGAILTIVTEFSYNFVLFAFITFIFHTATDYFTSRIVSNKFTLESPFNLVLDNEFFDVGDIVTADNKKELIVMSSPAGIGSQLKHNFSYRVKLYNSLPNFGAFTIIGFDQVLHYLQLFLTYYYLTN